MSTLAVEQLTPSKLRTSQLELLGDDVDLSNLYLALNHKDINIGGAVQDIVVDRTIQGASSVTVTVEDRDRVLLTSGRLSARNDIELDGLFFRLVSVNKQADILTLVFEDREVALLRTYTKPIKQALSTSRAKLTRAEFILRMIREVKEEKIRWVIPELSKVQPIASIAQLPKDSTKIYNRAFGIPKDNNLTVKGSPMLESQRLIANAVLDTGVSDAAPLSETMLQKMLVISMMTAIQESDLNNDGLNPDGSGSVGVFQQIKKWGWPASRDVPTDAMAFFDKLKTVLLNSPNIQYYEAAQDVQNSKNGSLYAQWRTEAERIVTAYGQFSGLASAANNQYINPETPNDYEFYRGVPPTSQYQKKRGNIGWGAESSWDCIQRLASDVQWRAFFVSGTFYYISDDDLIKSQPVATLDESTLGVMAIDGDYAENSKIATVNVTCRASRWAAPPGSVIQLKNMGPWDGRWLVNDISRSMFEATATIQLKKKMPRLPEPNTNNLVNAASTATTFAGTPLPGDGTTLAPTAAAAVAVRAAEGQLGVPYQWAGELENVKFDCSGLMQFAYAKAGIKLPRVAQAQYDYGILVQDGNLQPGDLVFFGKDTQSIEHVGMFVGNDTMIDAPYTGQVVRYDKDFQSYTNPQYQGATRPTIKGK